MYFKVTSTIIGPSLFGKETKSPTLFWLSVHDFKSIKKLLCNRWKLTDAEKSALRTLRYAYNKEAVNIPAFIWVSYYHEPVMCEVRMISKKEYEHIQRQEREENQTAWETYGEQKWGC